MRERQFASRSPILATNCRELQQEIHERYMQIALEEAAAAFAENEVPVGAVLIIDGEIIARAHNRRQVDKDPTAHAEMIVLRKSAERLGRWRLTSSALYVTVEPCFMCAGAMILARIDHLIYGCSDPKTGVVESLYRVFDDKRLNHKVQVTSGILGKESRGLIQKFFKERRGISSEFGVMSSEI